MHGCTAKACRGVGAAGRWLGWGLRFASTTAGPSPSSSRPSPPSPRVFTHGELHSKRLPLPPLFRRQLSRADYLSALKHQSGVTVEVETDALVLHGFCEAETEAGAAFVRQTLQRFESTRQVLEVRRPVVKYLTRDRAAAVRAWGKHGVYLLFDSSFSNPPASLSPLSVSFPSAPTITIHVFGNESHAVLRCVKDLRRSDETLQWVTFPAVMRPGLVGTKGCYLNAIRAETRTVIEGEPSSNPAFALLVVFGESPGAVTTAADRIRARVALLQETQYVYRLPGPFSEQPPSLGLTDSVSPTPGVRDPVVCKDSRPKTVSSSITVSLALCRYFASTRFEAVATIERAFSVKAVLDRTPHQGYQRLRIQGLRYTEAVEPLRELVERYERSAMRFSAPALYTRGLVGEGGAHLRQLGNEKGCFLTKVEEGFVLYGGGTQTAAAVQELERRLRVLEALTVTLTVNRGLYALWAGRAKGSALRQLREATKSDFVQEELNPTEDRITIYGEFAAEARSTLLKLMEAYLRSRCTVRVPHWMRLALMGKGGSGFTAITETSGALLVVDPARCGSHLEVHVYGLRPDDVGVAEALLQQRINHLRHSKRES